VGIFMNQIMDGKPLSVFGDGKQTRAFSYIGDVAPYIARCVDVPESYNQVFNIGADQEFSVNILAETVMKAMGSKAALRHLPPRNEVQHAFADHSKVKRIFNIKNLTTLEAGIEKMAKWAKTVGVRKSKKFGDIEVTQKLPSIWLED
jgi:UDP-glucose 4-epimerase